MIATVLTVAILIFGVGQLVLPSIAAHVVRGRVDKYGKVLSVSVSAFPAIELALGDADTVTVHMATYHAPESAMARNLKQAKSVTNLNVSVNTVKSGLFTATDAHLTKRGSKLVGSGQVSEASIRHAIPDLESVKLIGSANGVLTLEGTADVPFLGSISADFTVQASDGRIEVAFTGALSLLGTFTVWSDPQVRVTSLSGQATSSGMDLTAQAEMK